MSAHEEEDRTSSASEEELATTGDTREAGASSSRGGDPSKKKKKKKKSKASKALNAIVDKVSGRDNEGANIPDEVVGEVLDRVKRENPESKGLDSDEVRRTLAALKIMDVLEGKSGLGGKNRKDMGEHTFWKTQPVPQLGEARALEDGPIEPSRPLDQVKQEPDALPKDFEWTTVDLRDPPQSKEVYELLSANYVEDHDAAFRFQYSAEFLNWAMMPPGYYPEWHLGVRVKSTKKLVAFISGIPVTLRVRERSLPMSEINFLCVHKKLRSKRLAPVLIKEVTRQCHLKGIFQAMYTAGVVLPTPVSTCRYFHRSLNIPKLVDIKFTYIPRNATLARLVLRHKLPSSASMRGIREMEEKDIPDVKTLWERYVTRFKMHPQFTEDELRHNFISGRGSGEVVDGRRSGQVVWSYVVEEPKTNRITDFFTFYSLPSRVMQSSKHELLQAAYLFYYATSVAFEESAESLGLLKRRLLELIGDALVIAHQAKFDVFNALTLMDNNLFLGDLKFGPGDGYLNYYLYNWRTAPLEGFKALPADEGGQGIGRGVAVVML